jgi:hypothetical protein
MKRTISIVAAAGAVALAEFAARAAITASFSQVPITATTEASGADLTGYQCFDLSITLTPGDDFTSFRLLWDPPGPIFHHALGQPGPNFGPPNSLLFPTFPVLEFDSYLRGPAGSVTVLGSTDGTNDLPPPGIFDSDRLAVAAGDLSSNTQGGTFQLLRMTFGPGGPGFGIGRVFSVQNPDVGFQIFFPEPSMLTLVAAAGLLALCRRAR